MTAFRQTYEEIGRKMTKGDASTLPRCVMSQSFIIQIALSLQKRLKVLDLACGDGNIAHNIRNMKPFVSDVTILDIALSTARKANVWYNIPAICADGEHLPFKDKSFDVTLLVAVLEHVLDPEALIAEAERVSNWIISLVPAVEDNDPSHLRVYDLRQITELRHGTYYNDGREQFSCWRIKRPR